MKNTFCVNSGLVRGSSSPDTGAGLTSHCAGHFIAAGSPRAALAGLQITVLCNPSLCYLVKCLMGSNLRIEGNLSTKQVLL